MTDATILIPTHNHAGVLACSIRSALAQASDTISVEVFVVGDGVGNDTRRVVSEFDDTRVRFFDFPKGERHGERHRDTALQESSGEIICYLGDDDVLLSGHVAEMKRLLEDADFAHALPMRVFPGGGLRYKPGDLARPEFVELMRRGTNNFISLTGSAHSRAVYDRLPHGWRAAPPERPTDAHMWKQVFGLPGLRAVTGTKVTVIHFPDPLWRHVDDASRAATLESWLARSYHRGWEDEMADLLDAAVWRAAQDAKLRSIELSAALDHANEELALLRAGSWRRVGRRVTRFSAVRALRARVHVVGR